MKCIWSENTDPYFNLAAEEYLLKNFNDDIFMIWQSNPAIIVGKHQNALAEINHRFVQENNIKVARRLSGGGTVYHDMGNVNFTFIRNGEPGKLVDFRKFTEPVINWLNILGVPVVHGEKNDLLIGSKKISGNAEHVYKTRVLHHGTLLFNSNIEMLNRAINATSGVYTDKAVQSNRSTVTNIYDHLKKTMNVADFKSLLFNYVNNSYADTEVFSFNQADNQIIAHLVKEKYVTWKWIYGYSPRYTFNNRINLGNARLTIELNVEHGIIINAFLDPDPFLKKKSRLLSELVMGIKHEESELTGQLKLLVADSKLVADYFNEIIAGFFYSRCSS